MLQKIGRTIPARRIHLKIKIVSLSAEARLIRKEERRWPGESEHRTTLYLHRTRDVRREGRSALIAYGFLRGRAYRQIEPSNRGDRPGPHWSRVVDLVAKYGERTRSTAEAEVNRWRDA